MFDGFALDHVDVGEATLRVRYGGNGPAVLLLHGHPRTHATWHRVAPLLARTHTVVCPDLRGYGRSSKPPTTADHAPYSKRAMAGDCAALMSALGQDRFAVAGHDRGCYVAFRLAMDHPERIDAFVPMDGVPIGTALARCDATFARAWWHWFFLGNPDARADEVINRDPDWWYRTESKRTEMDPEAWEDFVAAVRDPATVRAMCEDYRAGLTVDRAHDEADRAADRRVTAPTLVMWAAQDDMEDLYGDPVEIWRDWATSVEGVRIDCGHHIAEEAPEQFVEALLPFLEKAQAKNTSS
ncbi:MAG TPA: alpha/beta hydrolase [Mycobacteriales bacterium]|nr:alpha/beta hydrolase [Mycobacteriales bacterium]